MSLEINPALYTANGHLQRTSTTGRKILWVRTPKCGITTLRRVFAQSGIYSLKGNVEFSAISLVKFGDHLRQNKDYYMSGEQGGDLQLDVNLYSRKAPKRHTTVDIYSVHKFAVVRNPYDRVVSSYCYARRMKWYHGTFRKFLMSSFKDFRPMLRGHTLPLTDNLCLDGEPPYLDIVVKFENFREGVNKLYEKFDLPGPKIPHLNKTKHKHYTTYYDDETRQIAAEKFAKDIECFEYEFGE
jgi:hypothetical protein